MLIAPNFVDPAKKIKHHENFLKEKLVKSDNFILYFEKSGYRFDVNL